MRGTISGGMALALHELAGVSESVPYPTALAQGATHVLVLRSRRDVLLARDARRAAEDAQLTAYDQAAAPAVFSIRPAADSPEVSRLATDGRLLRAAFDAGEAAFRDCDLTCAPARP